MAWVYILECSDGTFYVGSTRDLHGRVEMHMAGKGAQYTKHRLPVHLKHADEFESVADAFAMEKKLQGWSHAKRQAFIEGDWDAIRRLSQRRGGASGGE